MKAVVLELKGNKAAVLAPDGAVNFIKNKNYSVGQLLDIDTAPAGCKIIDFAARHTRHIAAAAMAAIIAGSMITANTYAYSRVTLDVNPSVEYTLNVFDRVIDMKAYNDDGAVIEEELGDQIHGKKFADALGVTLDQMENDNYIKGDTDAIVTVDSTSGKKTALKEDASESVKTWNDKRKSEGNKDKIELEVVEITPELEEKAEENHMTPGRVYLYEKQEAQAAASEEKESTPPSEDGSSGKSEDKEKNAETAKPARPEDEGNNEKTGEKKESPGSNNNDNKKDSGNAPIDNGSGKSDQGNDAGKDHGNKGSDQPAASSEGQSAGVPAQTDSGQTAAPAMPENTTPAQPQDMQVTIPGFEYPSAPDTGQAPAPESQPSPSPDQSSTSSGGGEQPAAPSGPPDMGGGAHTQSAPPPPR